MFQTSDWEPWLADASALLGAADLARAQRQRNAHKREELTLAYALHRLLLGARMGVDPVVVPLARDALGCPRLQDAPFHTSLSHSGGWVAAAVTGAGPVGVDIEPESRRSVMAGIAARVCHPAEAIALAGLAPAQYNHALLELWVRKEALLKAAGVGMAREMDTFMAPDDSLQALCQAEPAMTHVQMLPLGPDVIGAVAAPPGAVVESVWLRPSPAAGGG
ncbi:MAG: 4'-phosphopantetheinyl transferase superfamily protein [Lysobacter sp.]